MAVKMASPMKSQKMTRSPLGAAGVEEVEGRGGGWEEEAPVDVTP
jgi:hypothetical protein